VAKIAELSLRRLSRVWWQGVP